MQGFNINLKHVFAVKMKCLWISGMDEQLLSTEMSERFIERKTNNDLHAFKVSCCITLALFIIWGIR